MIHICLSSHRVVSFSFYPNVTTLRSGLCYRKSVSRLSVTCKVRAPYSSGWNFWQYFFPFCTLTILWPPCKILRRSSQSNRSVGVLNARGVAKQSDAGLIEGYYLIPMSRSGISSPDISWWVACHITQRPNGHLTICHCNHIYLIITNPQETHLPRVNNNNNYYYFLPSVDIFPREFKN